MTTKMTSVDLEGNAMLQQRVKQLLASNCNTREVNRILHAEGLILPDQAVSRQQCWRYRNRPDVEELAAKWAQEVEQVGLASYHRRLAMMCQMAEEVWERLYRVREVQEDDEGGARSKGTVHHRVDTENTDHSKWDIPEMEDRMRLMNQFARLIMQIDAMTRNRERVGPSRKIYGGSQHSRPFPNTRPRRRGLYR